MKAIRVTSTAAVVLLFGAVMPASAQHEGGEKQEEKQPQQHAQQPQRAAPQQHAAQPRPEQAQRAAQPKQQEQQRAAQSKPQEQPRAAQPKQQEQQRAAQPKQQEQQRAAQPAAQQNRAQTQQVRQQPQQSAPPQRTQQQARSWQQQKGWSQGGGWQGHSTFAQDRSQNWSSDHRTWGQRGGYGGYFIPQAQFSASFGGGHFFRLGVLPGLYLGYPQFSYGGFSFLMVDPWPSDWSENWYSSDDVYIDYNDGYYLHDRSHPGEALAITVRL